MILNVSHYPAIRAVIDTSLDEAVLPDATIEELPYLPAADLEVKALDPQWATRTGDALTRLQLAAIDLTAARLIVALPLIVREQHGGEYQYQRQEIDPVARAAALRAQAAATLAPLITPSDATPGRPTMFACARGRRGR